MCSRRQSLTVLLLACSETSPSPQFQCLSQYGAHVTGRFYVNIEVGGGRGLEVLKRMVQTMLNLYRRTSPFSGSRAKRKAWDTSVFPHCYNPAFSACLRLVVLMSDLAASLKQAYHACTGLWFRPSWACGARLVFSFALRVAAKMQSVAFTF